MPAGIDGGHVDESGVSASVAGAHQANERATLRRLQDQPSYLATRVFNNVVYGTGHPYERVRTDQSLSDMTREDLITFHDTYYRPQNATIVVSGDIKPDEAMAKVERAFGGWQQRGPKTVYDVPAPKAPAQTTVYLFDRPNSPQSVIMVGALGPRRDTPDYYAIELMNTALGGMFNSRINLNLREKHAYTYGAGSFFTYRRVPEIGTFTAQTLVVTAKTDSALIELMREIKDIRGARPVTQAELDMARANQTLSLPMRFETLAAMGGAVPAFCATTYRLITTISFPLTWQR
jgi:zinc protease